MLSYNELKVGTYISLDGAPHEVLSTHVFRKQQRKPVNQTKLRNLITGKVAERSFHQSETIEEAVIEKQSMMFLYKKPGRGSAEDEYWFSNPKDKSDRHQLPGEIIGEKIPFIKEGNTVDAVVYQDDIIDIQLPIKVQLKVTEAPPNVKGNTAQGGTKVVTLETGLEVRTPLFIEAGDVVEVNTQTGEYTTRVEKA